MNAKKMSITQSSASQEWTKNSGQKQLVATLLLTVKSRLY